MAQLICITGLILGGWGMATTPTELGNGGFASLTLASTGALVLYSHKDS